MGFLVAGLAAFLVVHMAQWPKGFRAGMVRRLGAGPWKGLYSLLSLAGFALIVWGYGQARAAGSPVLYVPPSWASHVALLLVPLSLILLAAAYTPTGSIKQTVKHPMLAGVKLWAAAHLLANGDLASVTLFGAFLAWAAADRVSVARRERAGLAAPPKAGRNALLGDALAVIIGLGAAFALVHWLHPILFGVPAWPF